MGHVDDHHEVNEDGPTLDAVVAHVEVGSLKGERLMMLLVP
jgi:hypothetical protein